MRRWGVTYLGGSGAGLCGGGKKSLSLCIRVRSAETLAVWWLVRWQCCWRVVHACARSW